MKYRYYVHDTINNVGITEFNSYIPGVFIECLIDCINWFMWESDNKDVEFYIHKGEEKIFITFSSDNKAYFQIGKENYTVDKHNITDFVKSHF